MRRADQGDAGALGELIARAILGNLYKFVIPSVAGPARLVPLAALADERISPSALRNAASRGAGAAASDAWRRWAVAQHEQLGGGLPHDALRPGFGVIGSVRGEQPGWPLAASARARTLAD